MQLEITLIGFLALRSIVICAFFISCIGLLICNDPELRSTKNDLKWLVYISLIIWVELSIANLSDLENKQDVCSKQTINQRSDK